MAAFRNSKWLCFVLAWSLWSVVPVAGETTVALGVLQATAPHASAYAESGVALVVVDLSWDRFEPDPDRVDDAYVEKMRTDIQTFRSAGLAVVLDFGIQYPPDWLFELPNSRYRNQYGERFVDTSPGMRMANAVFNQAVRREQADYVKAVFEYLGRDFYAVRLGWGWFGELNYPPHEYRGQGNAYWGFDPMAQGIQPGVPTGVAACPVPGWLPGSRDDSAAAREFVNWYLDSLKNYHDWQIRTVRRWYDGRLLMQYPSWGIRPDQLEAAIASDLAGTTAAEANGEVQRGFDFARFVAGIEDPNVILHTTWLDTDPSFGDDSGDNPAEWCPLHFLHSLAERHPLPLQVSGENTGGGGLGQLNLCVERVSRYRATLFFWAFERDLFDGRKPELVDLAKAFVE